MKKIIAILFTLALSSHLCLGQTNIGFEQTIAGAYTTSNAVSGWTVESTTTSLNPVTCNGAASWSPGSSEFSVVTTPVMANVYIPGNPFSIDNITIAHSPLGGNNIVRLQDGAGSGIATRLRSTFNVTSSNFMFYFAFAGSWDGSAHQCCDQPSFHLKVNSCGGTPNACLSLTVIPSGNLCFSGVSNYSVTNAVAWSDWKTQNVDLSAYIGSCVTIELINSDCTDNLHHGSVYFDAKTDVALKINYCPGSPVATILAPLSSGGYQWYSQGNPPLPIPTNSGGNSQLLAINNPLPGNTYTVQLQSLGGCTYTSQCALQYSSVTITGSGSNSTTCGSANGSANVVASGSGTGYNYAWYSAGNSTPVGTSSLISNLAAGIYTVGVSAVGSVGCGSAVATVTVGINTVSTSVHYYCQNEARLSAPAGVTNIHWYNGLVPVSAGMGGTAQNYTVTSPFANQYLWLSYNANPSCRDSVKIFLSTGGPVSFTLAASASTVCQGSNVTASITLPGPSAQYNLAWSPQTFLNSGALNQQTMSIMPYAPAGMTGNIIYTVVVTPTTVAMCAAGKTLSVFYISPFSPTIGVIPALCENAPPFTIPVNPVGGIFFGSQPVPVNGIIIPSYGAGAYQFSYAALVGACTATAVGSFMIRALPPVSISGSTLICSGYPALLTATGADTYTWTTNSTGSTVATSPTITSYISVTGTSTLTNCVYSKTVQITVNPLPVLSFVGMTTICSGQSTALNAIGANSYSWSTQVNGSAIVVSPTVTTSYSITGTNTLTNCSNTKSVQVSVNPIPALSITGSTYICLGETTTLTISGATGGYEWSNGSSTNSIVISPAGTTAYSVVGKSDLECANSTTITIEVSECTGTKENSDSEHRIQLFPNPTSDNVFINLSSPIQAMLYDQDGVNLFTKRLDAGIHALSLYEYPAGIYVLRCVGTFNPKAMKAIKIVRIPD